MNKSKIEWCDYTWNPITGCLHGCEYCYARRIAERFAPKLDNGKIACSGNNHEIKDTNIPFSFGFDPTFYKNRLEEPMKLKKPSKIFVCSMADLFGEWVPDEWIREVFKTCEAAPQHTYMFLTKNPKRYGELCIKNKLPKHKNFWYGTTTVTPDKEFFYSLNYNTFVSIEPILSQFQTIGNEIYHVVCDWVIIGAETGNRKDKVIPKREWIEILVNQCRNNNIPVFMKNSLKDIWNGELIQEFPKEMEGK